MHTRNRGVRAPRCLAVWDHLFSSLLIRRRPRRCYLLQNSQDGSLLFEMFFDNCHSDCSVKSGKSEWSVWVEITQSGAPDVRRSVMKLHSHIRVTALLFLCRYSLIYLKYLIAAKNYKYKLVLKILGLQSYLWCLISRKFHVKLSRSVTPSKNPSYFQFVLTLH